ncbi:MAG: tetratricopeptide repeat protein [Gammaproteobacteria bacterium]
MCHIRTASIMSLVLAVTLFASVSSLADFGSAMGLYQKGDYAAAEKEFTVLAGQGDADAQFILGDMHLQGQGVVKDNVRAYKWYDIAAKNGAQGAAEARDTLAKTMSADDVKKAQQLAQEWHPDTTTAAANPATAPVTSANAPAPESEGGFFKNLSRTVTGLTGGPGATSQSSTTVSGIRGLDAEMLRTASPDMNALQKMESYASNKGAAEEFAQNASLISQNLPYIETRSECTPSPTNALQSPPGSC